MYIVKWIEGEKNLEAFCLKRFKDKPSFCETIGHCGDATIHMIYKYRQDKSLYTQMFFLFMRHENGIISDAQLSDKEKMTYEQIRTDSTSILIG